MPDDRIMSFFGKLVLASRPILWARCSSWLFKYRFSTKVRVCNLATLAAAAHVWTKYAVRVSSLYGDSGVARCPQNKHDRRNLLRKRGSTRNCRIRSE